MQDSFVGHNGDHFTRNMWSDGVTLNQASPAVVQNNLFIDNSDINLILGSGTDSDVSGNRVFELQNGAFGGVMFDNFNGNTDGTVNDNTDRVVSDNTDRSVQTCRTCPRSMNDDAVATGRYLAPGLRFHSWSQAE